MNLEALNVKDYLKIRKGQIGTIELLMVIVIIGIIIAIGIYVVFTGLGEHTQEIGEELSLQEREVLLGMIGRMSEIRCDNRVCIDTSKLAAAGSVINSNKAYYTKILGFRSVKVEVVYPAENNKLCNIDSYPDCSIFKLYENRKPVTKSSPSISTLISLYYPHEKSYRVGRLTLEEYK